MEMLQKITNWLWKFSSSQENISDGVYFCAVASLQRVDWTSNINRYCNRLFSKNVPKTNCLIRTFWKSSYCDVLKKRGPPIHVIPDRIVLIYRDFPAWVLQSTTFWNFGQISPKYCCYSFCTGSYSFSDDDLCRIYSL